MEKAVILLLVSFSLFNPSSCHPSGRILFPDEEVESSTIKLSDEEEITAPDAVIIAVSVTQPSLGVG